VDCPQQRGTHDRNKTSIDIFWLRDENLEESDNLPDSGGFAQGIADHRGAALERLSEISADLARKEVAKEEE
jgi:type I restriction enzyme M protein